MTPVLDGVRVRLEPMTLEHLAGLEAVAFDDRIWRYLLTWMKTRDDLRRWVDDSLRQEAAGTAMPWVTVLKAENRVIGSTRFLDFDRVHMTTELGFTWLAPEFHGMGLNAEAKLLQLRFGFEELGLRRVGLKTHHENLQSQAAMRKIGATEEGTFRNHYVMPDGSARHSVWFSIIREEWPQVRSLLETRVGANPASA
jgi:RimJ/RimL family protein N-acetyltransferase